jgi:hypothetical protein
MNRATRDRLMDTRARATKPRKKIVHTQLLYDHHHHQQHQDVVYTKQCMFFFISFHLNFDYLCSCGQHYKLIFTHDSHLGIMSVKKYHKTKRTTTS